MTVVKDFIGGVHNNWLEKNIRDGFGKDLNSSNVYVARVLEVRDIDKPVDPKTNSAKDFRAKFRIRCRILTQTNFGGLEWHRDELRNPDANLPDPCDYLAADAKARIQYHPWYLPDGNKQKKPYIGDLVKVRRKEVIHRDYGDHVGEYIGFLVQTPPMDLEKPKGGAGGMLGNKKWKKQKRDDGKRPPVKYGKGGKPLQPIAQLAAEAINSAFLSGVDSTGNWPDPETKEKFAGFERVDKRIMTAYGPGKTEEFAKIPATWYNSAHQDFKIISHIIEKVSGGYPGMPNGNVRAYLAIMAKRMGTDAETEENKAFIAAMIESPPSMEEFATKEEYWKLWWTGVKKRTLNAGLFGRWKTLVTKQTSVKGYGFIRYGFGSFQPTSAAGLPGNPKGALYFPRLTSPKKKIYYAGAKGIGDPVCEMYALMMFIRINFGTPYQFTQMAQYGKLVWSAAAHQECAAAKAMCVQKQIRNPMGVNITLKFRAFEYKIDRGVMPRNSSYRCGMCEGWPPFGDG